MRTKTIVEGFKNSQKFRFILTPEQGGDVGLTITVRQMSDCFATRDARIAVWDALLKLSYLRHEAQRQGQPLPVGLVHDAQNYGFRQVQVDLH